MTGYGRGAAERQGRRAVVEIRSVNHRFLDLKLRGAALDPAVEEPLVARIRKRIERGAVTVTVRIDSRGAATAVGVDRTAARRIYQELTSLARDLGVSQPVSLELVCAQPGVIVAREGEGDEDLVAAVVAAAADTALDALTVMRDTEGATLAADLGARLARLAELVDALAGMAAVAPAEARRRLEERVARLMASSKVEVDEARLAQEVALVADKVDVTEELVRLRSHIEQASDVCKQRGAIGRRMDFLVQEMGRELNTVASKSQSAEIARTVVDAKAELEKAREQIQNIE